MNYKRINNITGWIICIIACTIYIMTMEASGSLWDCGEFASCAYKLQIPHPPGAPLFVLIGRLFMVPFDPKNAATGINTMSALASGFTILFLFWSITHFAKKILQKGNPNTELNGQQVFSAMAAGVVGSLAYCFSDSFWYSAVESEVYALSSFFTAVVFWAVLKWEDAVTEEQKKGINGHFTGADRWLILIFYLMGLSIGVHLLNLLSIPAAVMVYYFKRYKITKTGTVIAFVIGCVITGIVQKFLIQSSIKGAGAFDILFKNDFGLPFFAGFAIFFALISVLIWWGLRIANKRNWNFLKLSLWCTAFMLLGYSSYITTLERSIADPAVDMYNVDNPVSLVGYLSREQYGETPIMFGPDFTAGNVADEAYDPDVTYEDTYIKTKTGYEKKGKKQHVEYRPEDEHLFPRMWDAGNEQGHAQYYADFANIQKINVEETTEGGQKATRQRWERKPTFGENVGFFTQYQLGWMYLRYFMWNFAGKQNDIQGINMANVRDGNWKTGIGFIDNLMWGDQDKMPDSMKNNKANNKLYCLPLILGILGLIYQYKKDRKDALVTALLFFFTGVAIIVYLNMPGNMPRERDYVFVGSFYVFAIWIGLGVLFVKDLVAKFANAGIANYVAAAVCTLAVPVLMASQEWDDHDRSKKTMARDLATDYLESCAPNAIVVSFGDNDTYPLWYAQEVEGVRRDVRVINSSLLGIDWYINQLRYKLNDSDPIDPIWSIEQIEGSNRDIVLAASYMYGNSPEMISTYWKRAGVPVPPGQPMDLYTMMKDFAGSDDPSKTERGGGGTVYNVFPTNSVTIPVDTNLVRSNKTVNPEDRVVSQLQFDIPKNVIQKNDAAILNIIAANKWKRPIYFTSQRIQLGFDKYLRQDGMAYRLVPVENDVVNKPWVKEKMMDKFVFGGAEKPGVYFDEENRRHLNSIRLAYASAALNLAAHGDTVAAKKLLTKCDQNMVSEDFPYGMVSRDQQQNSISLRFLDAAMAAGDNQLANKVMGSLKKDLEQQMVYYAALNKSDVNKLRADADSLLSRQYRSEQEINYLNYVKPPNYQQMVNQRRYQQQMDMTNFQENLTGKLRPIYDEVLSCFQILENVKEKEKTLKGPVVKSVETPAVIGGDTPVNKQP
ncbi:MAG: DUF2723 domain-containing protein [Bacteroidota bacterium]